MASDVMALIKARAYGDLVSAPKATVNATAMHAVGAGVVIGLGSKYLLKANDKTAATIGVIGAIAVAYGAGVAIGSRK